MKIKILSPIIMLLIGGFICQSYASTPTLAVTVSNNTDAKFNIYSTADHKITPLNAHSSATLNTTSGVLYDILPSQDMKANDMAELSFDYNKHQDKGLTWIASVPRNFTFISYHLKINANNHISVENGKATSN